MTKFIIITFNVLISLVFLGNDGCIFVEHKNNLSEKPNEVTSAKLLAVKSIVNFGQVAFGTTKKQDIKFTNESNMIAHDCNLIGLSHPFIATSTASSNSIPAQKTVSFSINVDPKIPGMTEAKIALVCRNAQNPAFVTLKVEVNGPTFAFVPPANPADSVIPSTTPLPNLEPIAVTPPAPEKSKNEEPENLPKTSSPPNPPKGPPPPLPVGNIMAENEAKEAQLAEQQKNIENKIKTFFETLRQNPIKFSEKKGMAELSLITAEEMQILQEKTQEIQKSIKKGTNPLAKKIAQAKLKNNVELMENLLTFNRLKEQREKNVEKIKILNTNFDSLSKHKILKSQDYMDYDKGIILLSKQKNPEDLEKEIQDLNKSKAYLKKQIEGKEDTDLIEIKQKLGETSWSVLVSKIKKEMIPQIKILLKQNQANMDEILALNEAIIEQGKKTTELDEDLKKFLSIADDTISLKDLREKYLNLQQEANNVKKSAENLVQEQERTKERITQLKTSVIVGIDAKRGATEKNDSKKGSKEQDNLVQALTSKLQKDQKVILEEDFLKNIYIPQEEQPQEQE